MKRQRQQGDGSLELENAVVAAIFQIGLNQSSPKSLISLMPETPELTREHIKSHLQKYRIQSERSNEQFIDFFEKHMRAEFHQFLTAYESSNDSVSELSKKKVEPLDSHQAPLLVVATEPVLISSASTQPGFDNAGGDATRSDSTGSVTGAPPTDLEKLKAEFDSAYKESLDIKNSLTEFTGVL